MPWRDAAQNEKHLQVFYMRLQRLLNRQLERRQSAYWPQTALDSLHSPEVRCWWPESHGQHEAHFETSAANGICFSASVNAAATI